MERGNDERPFAPWRLTTGDRLDARRRELFARAEPVTRSRDPEAVALVEDSLRRIAPKSLANAVISVSLRRPELTSTLRQIRCPTLLATGADHQDWTPEQAQAASELLENATAEAISGSAYLLPLEAPAETARLIVSFWD